MSEQSGCINTGDTTWVMVSAVLVLGMIPALGMFEAGLLRAISTTSILSQVFGGVVVLGFMWDLIGFTLVFGDSLGGVIGNPASYGLMFNTADNGCFEMAQTIPRKALGVFQMMFASITPLLMTGAYAERVRWRAFLLLTVLWELFVYYPIAHWIWNSHGWLRQYGVLDFAGGIVIHTTAGIGGLVFCWIMGPRKHLTGLYREKHALEAEPSNIPLACIGAMLLWLGWFGFNGGSALTAGSVAVNTISTTQASAVSCGSVWLFWSWYDNRREGSTATVSIVAILNGVIAGLAGITPASGYVDTSYGLIIGIILGVSSLWGCYFVKQKLKIDDALDVSAVHGLTGLVGSLCIGIFADTSINSNGDNGLIASGSFRLLGIQAVGVAVALVYAGFVTLCISYFLKKTIGLRVTDQEEQQGVDIVEHAEPAYEWMILQGMTSAHADIHTVNVDSLTPRHDSPLLRQG